MTLVTADIKVPDPDGNPVPARGYLNFVPTASLITGTAEVLPLSFTVPLVNGQASAELLPSGIGWAWTVNFRILGFPHYSRTYIVPNTTSIDIQALTEVDSTSLEPNAEPDPLWYGWVENIVAGQLGVVSVVTGNEPRPSFPAVFWLGGTTQPLNMADGTDIWFKAA